jgi:hypothetical protein
MVWYTLEKPAFLPGANVKYGFAGRMGVNFVMRKLQHKNS